MKHSDRMYYCDKCDFKSPYKGSANSHKKIHDEDSWFQVSLMSSFQFLHNVLFSVSTVSTDARPKATCRPIWTASIKTSQWGATLAPSATTSAAPSPISTHTGPRSIWTSSTSVRRVTMPTPPDRWSRSISLQDTQISGLLEKAINFDVVCKFPEFSNDKILSSSHCHSPSAKYVFLERVIVISTHPHHANSPSLI